MDDLDIGTIRSDDEGDGSESEGEELEHAASSGFEWDQLGNHDSDEEDLDPTEEMWSTARARKTTIESTQKEAMKQGNTSKSTDEHIKAYLHKKGKVRPDPKKDGDVAATEATPAAEEEELANLADKRLQQVDVKIEMPKEHKGSYFAGEAKPGEKGCAVASFQEMNLSKPLLKAIKDCGFKVPTPVQSRTVPIALMGHDVCGSAVTGSGKTAAFLLPILERLLYRQKRVASIRVVILLPTRELAVQCQWCQPSSLPVSSTQSLYQVGGLSFKSQEATLAKAPDIIVATPARLIDHLCNAHSFGLDTVEILVLDEADRMLDMGFRHQVDEVVKRCPKKRQTLLFSATLTEDVSKLMSLALNNPVRVRVDQKLGVALKLTEEFIRIRPDQENSREAIVLSLCARSFTSGVLVFFDRKTKVHRLKIIFGLLGLDAAELHGNMTMQQRLDALEDFKAARVPYLLATDIAARGLDISGVKTVINLEMPKIHQTYIHRVGRTARAARNGHAITMVGDGPGRKVLKEIAKLRKSQLKSRTVDVKVVDHWAAKIQEIERDVIEVMKSERIEKECRQADMEANKAQNMMDHREEIYSRPAKRWFQTPQEKFDVQEKSYAASTGRELEKNKYGKIVTKEQTMEPAKAPKRKRDPNAGLSRTQRRRKMFMAEEGEEAFAAGQAAQKAQKVVGMKGEVKPAAGFDKVKGEKKSADRKRPPKEKLASFEDGLVGANKFKPSSQKRDQQIEKANRAKGGSKGGKFKSQKRYKRK